MEAGETAEMEEGVMTEELSEDDNREVDTDEVDLDDKEVDLDDRENSTWWEQGGNKVRRRTFFDIFENDQLSEEGEEGHRDNIQKNSKKKTFELNPLIWLKRVFYNNKTTRK